MRKVRSSPLYGLYKNRSAVKLERIGPPKREQVQFLFLSLGLHCIAGCVLRGSVNPPRGEEGADSSNMICILEPIFLLMLHSADVQ
jgi:hypothetical protein